MHQVGTVAADTEEDYSCNAEKLLQCAEKAERAQSRRMDSKTSDATKELLDLKDHEEDNIRNVGYAPFPGDVLERSWRISKNTNVGAHNGGRKEAKPEEVHERLLLYHPAMAALKSEDEHRSWIEQIWEKCVGKTPQTCLRQV